MIQLPGHVTPSAITLEKLRDYQGQIDKLGTFEEKSDKAKTVFSSKNKIGNKVFDEIKVQLTNMCSGARRCVYCEDSVADEVEHIHPKDLYPEMCFRWDNYVYACGSCNGPKNNKFAVFRSDDGEFQVVNPPRGQRATAPPAGEDALINPRKENPLDFCMLDLESTFKFVVIADEGSREYKKANYTYYEVLRLNEREFLREARKNAFGNYKARLYEYTYKKKNGSAKIELDKMIEGIKSESHPTVWKEMQRYHVKGWLHNIDKDLDTLFIQSPESIEW